MAQAAGRPQLERKLKKRIKNKQPAAFQRSPAPTINGRRPGGGQGQGHRARLVPARPGPDRRPLPGRGRPAAPGPGFPRSASGAAAASCGGPCAELGPGHFTKLGRVRGRPCPVRNSARTSAPASGRKPCFSFLSKRIKHQQGRGLSLAGLLKGICWISAAAPVPYRTAETYRRVLEGFALAAVLRARGRINTKKQTEGYA